MAMLLGRMWWALFIQGLIAVVFGLLIMFWPQATLFILIILFGIYAVLDGLFAAVGAIIYREQHPTWWLTLLWGILSLLLGIAAFVWPSLTGLVLLWLIAARALLIGLLQIVGALRLREQVGVWWLFLLGGIISVLFAIVAFAWPGATALALVWLIGLYVGIVGVVLCVVALLLRSWYQEAVANQPAIIDVSAQ